jgi:hypothetical protein
MRIAGSPPGLQFDVVIAPNTFVKQKKREERRIDEAIGATRARFWSALNAALDVEPSCADCQRRYGGRLGFEWLLPKLNPEWQQDEPHVLLYISAGRTNHQIGIGLFCRNGARPEAEERMQHATEAAERAGVPVGQTAADFSTEASMDAAVAEMVRHAKVGLNETPLCLRLSGRSEAADQAKFSIIKRCHVRVRALFSPSRARVRTQPCHDIL